MTRSPSCLVGIAAAVIAAMAAACAQKSPPSGTYFERSVAPILQTSCTRTGTGAGCHVASPKGNAFGNLDTSSFAAIDRRRDLLVDYGPYGQPALLAKAVDPFQVQVESFDGTRVTVTTDIKHTGGSILEPTATAYGTLRRWIDNGATENNGGRPPAPATKMPCAKEVPEAAGFDPSQSPTRPDFATFQRDVSPLLGKSCAATNCHGTPANELYLTCGDTPEQVRWNYHVAQRYLGQTSEQSEIVRRPLAPSQGGAFHEGGVLFTTREDGEWQKLEGWAREHGPFDAGALEPAFGFFAHRVQPVLVKKGCMMLQCHSASQFHDYRLRGGSGGAFSYSATRKNYELSLAQISVESADPSASRMIAKNLYRPEAVDGGLGIAHRGGSLFEDFAGKTATGALCDDAKPDYDGGDLDRIPAYCVVREWIRRERDARRPAPFSAILWVRRPADGKTARAQDFDVYAPGADLRLARGTMDDAGAIQVSAESSLTAGCGLDVASADVRRPAVSWDGARIAFAARGSAAEPLAVYTAKADGTECARHAAINAGPTSGNGLLIHNFDPAFSPPDANGQTYVVFASTRGNSLPASNVDYSGPQRAPADPSKANADLWVLEPSGLVRQLTYLLNMERMPSFMQDGRLTFTAEKRAPGFYQLAGRRVNLDGGDYHPLFAQRRSVGFFQMTEIAELPDKDLAGIFSDPGNPHGGGRLGVVNRSIGIDFQSTDPGDYVVDPGVIDPASPASPEPGFFLRSLRFPDPARDGVYRSPAALPTSRVLVSYASGDGGDYDVFTLDPRSGARAKVLGAPGVADVEAVAVFGRGARGIFRSALDEPNGHTRVAPGQSDVEVTYLDVPVLASLLFQNTPTGRTVESDLKHVEMWEEMPPPPSVTSLDSGGPNVAKDGFGAVYVRRRKLGDVPLQADGSVKVRLPGGVPIAMKLPDTAFSQAHGVPRFQRETTSFNPGERVHQSFRRDLFDSLCAACHGALSGRPLDFAVRPDVLTQASQVSAAAAAPLDLAKSPADRGPIEGP